jgi:hypothetical protein
MARRSKQDYLELMGPRYQHAGRAERSALLDEVTRMCGYHRKYAIGLLNRRQPPRLVRGLCPARTTLEGFCNILRLSVEEIVDLWYTKTHGYFRVHASNGGGMYRDVASMKLSGNW